MTNGPHDREAGETNDSSKDSEHSPETEEAAPEYGSEPLIMSWAKSRRQARPQEAAASGRPDSAEQPPGDATPAAQKRYLWKPNPQQPQDEQSRKLVQDAARSLRLDGPDKP